MRVCELHEEGILRAVANHRMVLSGIEANSLAEPFSDELKAPTHWQVVRHALFMCNEVEILVRAGALDRANRWLGFIQGLLFCNGLISSLEMRNINAGLSAPLQFGPPTLLPHQR